MKLIILITGIDETLSSINLRSTCVTPFFLGKVGSKVSLLFLLGGGNGIRKDRAAIKGTNRINQNGPFCF